MPSGIPSQPAQLCLLASLPPAHATEPPRVRFVGRVAGLDAESATAVLVDMDPLGGETAAVLIDLTLPVLRGGKPTPRLKDQIMVTGEVTRLAEPLPTIPTLAVVLPSPVKRPLDLRTVVTIERFDLCEGLDMEQWRAAVRAVQAVRNPAEAL
ncbi:hypothetical protein JCM10908_005182 [Rhodotorula pacifica]|uniref:uncharacterized protein n=1 Tax=Rhodotorula pacifica TaxID=1495444 RepID=UPI0031771DDA